jgi:hypothetical protein
LTALVFLSFHNSNPSVLRSENIYRGSLELVEYYLQLILLIYGEGGARFGHIPKLFKGRPKPCKLRNEMHCIPSFRQPLLRSRSSPEIPFAAVHEVHHHRRDDTDDKREDPGERGQPARWARTHTITAIPAREAKRRDTALSANFSSAFGGSGGGECSAFLV